MRDINLEAAVWYLFGSTDFFEAAAQECEATMQWFGTLAVAKQVAGFGKNNQIYDSFKSLARDFRRGAELAKLGDYELIWETARCVSGDVRGMMEQRLHSWMNNAEYQEFSEVRIGRLITCARQITRVLNNAMTAADSYFDPDPECPERANDDDGFPGSEIAESYRSNHCSYNELLSWGLPDPLPQYFIDKSVTCKTGDEVPWTGVWYPDTGLERYSLTFAIKGLRMQPAFQVIKTKDELKAEGVSIPIAETVAVATAWHPLVPCSRDAETDKEQWAKAGEPCPKAGKWQPADMGAAQRTYELGETMGNLGSAYGLTVWRWIQDC